MFGFITPNKKELSEGDRLRYEEVYCGMCHALGKRCGHLSRFALNNDMTFVALLLMSVYEPREIAHKSACAARPCKLRVWSENDYVNYAADMTLALTYFKLMDDWQDEVRVSARVGAGVFKRQYRRVRGEWPVQCEALERGMREIARAEREQMECARVGQVLGERGELKCAQAGSAQTKQAQAENVMREQAGHEELKCERAKGANSRDLNPDVVANLFGGVMSRILVVHDDFWQEPLARFGAHFGRFIYMMDAAFDAEDDRKRGNYNPFFQSGFTQDDIYDLLLMYAGNMASAFEVLPCVQDVDILRNVLYSGIWIKYQAKFQKESEREE